MINEALLATEIENLLTEFYNKRFGALEKTTLTVLLSKNPYLYRSLGISKHSDLIEELLAARVSSSDETIFGNCFLEPLAFWAASNSTAHGDLSRKASVGAGAGFDISIETDSSYLAVAVKSGKNIFNSQSTKGQSSEFDALQARMAKMKKHFRKIIGYGYGRKRTKKETPTEKLAGQEFWTLITAESDFYLRISETIGKLAAAHAPKYKEEYDKKTNLLTADFILNFLDIDGSIAWERLVQFNSGTATPSRLKSGKQKTLELTNKTPEEERFDLID